MNVSVIIGTGASLILRADTIALLPPLGLELLTNSIGVIAGVGMAMFMQHTLEDIGYGVLGVEVV